MKNIEKKLISIILLGLFVLVACEKFLEEDYRSGITTGNFFNNDKEAQLAVNGLYNLLKDRTLYGRFLNAYLVMGTEEVGQNRGGGELDRYLIAEGSGDGLDQWAQFYKLARNTSLFLENIDGNDKLSDAVRNQAVGEILFLRALTYFNLTNLWGDVPYFRELPSTDELSVIERSPKDQIRADMKNDLERAKSLMPESYSGSDLSRATKWAAAALKAKFHLFDKEWGLALAECNDIINNSPHILLDNFADVFDQSDLANQINDEHIFVIDYTIDVTKGPSSQSFTDPFNPRMKDEPENGDEKDALSDALAANGEGMTGFGQMIPLPEIADQANWQAGDLRYDDAIVTEYLGFTLKFPYYRKMWNLNQLNSPRNNHPDNYIVFRLADIYLMAAEAENELNGPANAYQYVNKVRERAFNPDQPWNGMSQAEFREAMYDERKYELAAEGHRKMDLIRWGILLDVVKNTQYYSWCDPTNNIKPHHVLLPIPLSEILLNPNLLSSDPTNNGYR